MQKNESFASGRCSKRPKHSPSGSKKPRSSRSIGFLALESWDRSISLLSHFERKLALNIDT
jgi:hypothetical protein